MRASVLCLIIASIGLAQADPKPPPLTSPPTKAPSAPVTPSAPRPPNEAPGLFYPARSEPIGCVSRSAVGRANDIPASSDRVATAAWNSLMDAGRCFPALDGTVWQIVGINSDGETALMRMIAPQRGPYDLYFMRRDLIDRMGRHPWISGDAPPPPGTVTR